MRKFGKHFWDNKTFVISAHSDQPVHPHVRGRYNLHADDGKIKIQINKKYIY